LGSGNFGGKSLSSGVEIYSCCRRKNSAPVAAPAIRDQRSVRDSIFKNLGLRDGSFDDFALNGSRMFDWSRLLGDMRAFDVNKATSFTVGASTDSMEGFTYFSLVLGMTGDMSKLSSAMGELAFHAISTSPGFLEGSAKLGFIEILSSFFFEGSITSIYDFRWDYHLGDL